MSSSSNRSAATWPAFASSRVRRRGAAARSSLLSDSAAFWREIRGVRVEAASGSGRDATSPATASSAADTSALPLGSASGACSGVCAACAAGCVCWVGLLAAPFTGRTVTPAGASPPDRAACRVATNSGLRIVDVPRRPICLASSLSSISFIPSRFWLVATRLPFLSRPYCTGPCTKNDCGLAALNARRTPCVSDFPYCITGWRPMQKRTPSRRHKQMPPLAGAISGVGYFCSW